MSINRLIDMSSNRLVAAAVAAVVASLAIVAVVTASEPAPEPTDLGESANVARELVEVKRATSRYRDVSEALDDGYRVVSECVAEPGVGGMGYHFENPELVKDGELDIRKPEVLVYQRRAGGGLRLGAVEWMIPDGDGNVDTDDDRPRLFDRPMDGPQQLGPDVLYTLHAWIYRHNPAGVFAGYNPEVRC